MVAPVLLLVESGDGVDGLIVLPEVDVGVVVYDIAHLRGNVVMVSVEILLSLVLVRTRTVAFKLMVNLWLLLVGTAQFVDDLPELGAVARGQCHHAEQHQQATAHASPWRMWVGCAGFVLSDTAHEAASFSTAKL